MPRLAGAFLIAVFAVLPSEAFAQSGKPLILSITNAASYSTGPISPGEMVTIFGSSLGPAGLVNLTLDGQGRIATSLSEVQILFDGVAAPLLYVSQNQLSAMVPYAIAGRQSSQVQAVYRDVASNAFSKTVALSAPGIFTADSSGKRIAAAINGDGTVNTTSNPVTPGSYLTLFLTGEGQTNPPGIDGNIASSTANTVLPVSVRLGGRLVQSLYTGSAPGNVNGFAQLNVAIPADLPFGGNLPLGVQIGEAFSQPELTVAVAGPPAPLPGTPQLL
ncbi:MAG: IPT/TIG domain-containing protein, partial [Bryobacteraceae bacterium]